MTDVYHGAVVACAGRSSLYDVEQNWGWLVFSRFIVLENHPVYSCALHPDCCKLLNFGLWVSVKYLFKYQFINWY